MEVENMTLVNAIQALFAQNAPAGANFDEASDALKGKKDDDLSTADIATLDELAETFQDFASDPAGWLKKASATDPRYLWWVQLAQALGATSPPLLDKGRTAVRGSEEPSGSRRGGVESAGSPELSADLPALDIEPEQGIDPDALAGGAPAPGSREGGGTGGGGFSISTADNDRPRREKKRTERRDRNRDDEDEEDGREDRPPRRERKPPEPPPRPKPIIDVTDRSIPAITRAILEHSSYRTWSAWLIEAFRLIRTGTPAQQSQKRAMLGHMRTLIQSMKASQDRMEIQAGYHLERLLEVLEAGRDQREPAWFQANYVTGSYG